MKRLLNLFTGFLNLALIIFFTGLSSVSGQSAGKPKQYPIPDEILSVFQVSCIPCHGDKGGRLPASKLKFSRWKAYGAARQAEKASMICTQIRKEKMPPKSEREAHPEKILTKYQIDMICKWAESIKPQKTKK